MVRRLELVLDVVNIEPRGSSAGAVVSVPRPPDSAAMLCAALPSLAACAETSEAVSIVTFDHDGALARAGWRIAVETRGAAHCVVASSRREWTPGVVVVEPIFSAHLETEGLDGALFDAAPQAFREALAAAGQLAPSATLTAERRVWAWPRDTTGVELELDADVCATRDEMARLHELRVSVPWPEETQAAPLADALFACAHELVDALPAFVRVSDALERAAQGSVVGDEKAVHAAPVDLRGASSAQEALVTICANISVQWFGNDAGVRDSANTEFIHQMRVSQRRLRTAMRIFSHWRDETWRARIEPDLKWIGALLGEARDRDVFVESTLPALASADKDSARWQAVRDEAEAARLAARARVSEALASLRYAHAALAWLQWLANLAQQTVEPDEAGASLHRHARKRIRRYYERLAQAQKLTAIDEASRHRVRINAKYLRYTLEFFASVTSRRTRTETARTLARLQGVLGDGNDAAVALRFLDHMDAEPYQRGFARGWCEAVKRYTAKEGERLLRELRAPKVARGA
ncbi:CHAD domain-containing protein [Paraburkholderia bannensis]|uniref:CHAD domain-containing protein n=1 Tax=Paraburkholderia bannensis TaxID=765414 RepID=A0A7W9TX23_9BURK|nr:MULTISPECIES: CHAD domain-containing protein [Paraburkholderia]MBB3256991.1 CHAD domain-containing protein [Paraburkholderia sp. WP4_3_2]MBB6101945.1 CHAD domain-containing protein [Paraburkholderia bannensis]